MISNKDGFILQEPDTTVSVQQVFGIESNMQVAAFSKPANDMYVPKIDKDYIFDPETTLSILAGFTHNRRVMIQGYHGTGKSTHIEQVAAHLNWPCIRINLDSHISRTELIGRDAIVLKDNKQVTEFQQGLLPWALQNPVAIVFDEYDAGRPDVMFVLQRLLEADGRMTLLEQNMVITPHKSFRIFATANTAGLGDTTGLYHGTQIINQGQMDRWHIIAALNYLSEKQEIAVLLSRCPSFAKDKNNKDIAALMVRMAHLTRQGFQSGDLSVLMSPRTVLHWAENYLIFNDLKHSFRITFLNRADPMEHSILAEYYQRCFGEELSV